MSLHEFKKKNKGVKYCVNNIDRSFKVLSFYLLPSQISILENNVYLRVEQEKAAFYNDILVRSGIDVQEVIWRRIPRKARK